MAEKKNQFEGLVRKVFYDYPNGESSLSKLLPKPKPLTPRQIANQEIRELKQRLKDALAVLNGTKIAVDPSDE